MRESRILGRVECFILEEEGQGTKQGHNEAGVSPEELGPRARLTASRDDGQQRMGPGSANDMSTVKRMREGPLLRVSLRAKQKKGCLAR